MFAGVLKDIESADNRVILFIDEIHSISGAGASEGMYFFHEVYIVFVVRN
jgi:ATP-dependent Clp protease ATP-binding subunit ClpA